MTKCLFSPRAIAVIGASRKTGKLGHSVLKNLLGSGFGGSIYPVNPKAEEVLGLPCYPGIEAVPAEVDMVVITTPASEVLDLLDRCGRRGVEAAIVISAGFRETGHEGLVAEERMRETARRYGMGIVGPNCLGVIDTLVPYNASFAAGMPSRGHIAFMSQSGALCTAILDMSEALGVGFSRFVSLGNKAHLNEVDFLEAWGKDPESRVIIAYLEGISDGARFMEVARRVSKQKPIIAVKSGSTSAGSRAVSSHTGTLAGSESAYEAAFRQSGITRAESVDELFDFGVVLARQPLPENDRVAVITNAGGPGIMATDAIERAGLGLASLSQSTMKALADALPSAASVINPVDVLGDAGADRYRRALELVAKDPDAGALLVILTPQIMTQVEETARAVVSISKSCEKTVVACFMGDVHVRAGVDLLNRNGIPNYTVPERGVRSLRVMAEQRRWRRRPLPEIVHVEVDRAPVRDVIRKTRKRGRPEVGEAEGRAVLKAYGVAMPPSRLCRTPDAAVEFARKIGYPVVMKIASPDIFHKTDIGGVRLDVRDARDVRDTFDLLTLRTQRYMPDAEIRGCLVQQQVVGGMEVIIGMNRDPQFGPLIMFGLGGIYVEVLKDVSFRVAPLSKQDAQEMVSEIRAANILHGVRGQKRVDIEAIIGTLLRISQMSMDFPEIVEMEINPLVVFEQGQGAVGIDVRLVVSDLK